MNVRLLLLLAIALAALAAALGWWLHQRPSHPELASGLPISCDLMAFESVDYVVCRVDPKDVAVRYADSGGKPYGSLDAFDAAMRSAGVRVVLAMNAGMYHEDMSSVGLLVEDGREIAPLETREGEGNFFLKPNGVFLVDAEGRAAVVETGAYMSVERQPRLATQSGPMLVIDGEIHPRFLPDGESRHTRNGIGVDAGGSILMVISLEAVSLGSFARLFRDGLGCPNALFLDGAISTLSNGERTLIGGDYPVGPILAVMDPATVEP